MMDEEAIDGLYPVFFGVSCAFFALELLPDPEAQDRGKLFKGGAHLLAMFLWKVVGRDVAESRGRSKFLLQKLEKAEIQIEELKRRRSEEAKANERVVSIVAAREQSWFNERKKLRQQIGSLMNELRISEARNEKSLHELRARLIVSEDLIHEKDRLIESKRQEIEERASAADELREMAKGEAECHSSELLRHKTAIIELVSSQRRVDAELNRAVRRFEAAREEADSLLEEKEQAVEVNQRLSTELVKMSKDLEHKDQVLSVLLRKSEKRMLLREFKMKKTTMRKQEKPETARWKAVSESKNERHLFRNFLSKHVMRGHNKGLEVLSLLSDQYLAKEKNEKKMLHNHGDIEAFVEQLRLKDERLKALQWRQLSTDIETKRLQSYVQGLEQDFAQLRHENMKLETLILDQETELDSLKHQLLSLNTPPTLQQIKCLADGTPPRASNKTPVDDDQLKDIVLAIQCPPREVYDTSVDSNDVGGAEASTSVGRGTRREFTSSSRKMDLHALGVTYKIKRLKQQLLVLETLKGKRESSKDENQDFAALISLLNKQADRYESLQGKTDDLCQKMLDSNLNLSSDSASIARTKDEAKILEHFLGETFQLQRYIVATGQKLTQVQARIASELEGNIEKSFDSKRFADTMRALFREVQMGLEIRISRIIGDLEGTLACNGIIHLKK